MQNIRAKDNQLIIYESDTDEDIVVIPNNQEQRDAWATQLSARRESIKTSQDEQKASDELHIALYEHFLSEYDREIEHIVDE